MKKHAGWLVALVACSSPAVAPPAPAPVIVPVADAPVASTPPPTPTRPAEFPEPCWGSALSLATIDPACTSTGAAEQPFPASVHGSITAPATTVAPGATLTVTVTLTNDGAETAAIDVLLPDPSPFARREPGFAIAEDARGRNVNVPAVGAFGMLGAGRAGSPPTARLGLAPHGTATLDVTWKAEGYPQDLPPTPPADPPKPKPKPKPFKKRPNETEAQAARRRAIEAVVLNGDFGGAALERKPLAPGAYVVIATTNVRGAPTVRLPVRVSAP